MRGYGRGWYSPRMTVSSGYTYIGPCRCGTGPHAFYQRPKRQNCFSPASLSLRISTDASKRRFEGRT